MKSWKMRLFLALIALAMVLAVSVPAIADITVQCNVDDEGYCDKSVSYDSDEEESADPDLQETNVEEPVVQEPAVQAPVIQDPVPPESVPQDPTVDQPADGWEPPFPGMYWPF
jgi:hypothetical protein